MSRRAGGIAKFLGPAHPILAEAGLAGERLIDREAPQRFAAFLCEMGKGVNKRMIRLARAKRREIGEDEAEDVAFDARHFLVIDQRRVAQGLEPFLKGGVGDMRARRRRNREGLHRLGIDIEHVEKFAARGRVGAVASRLGGVERV